MHFRRCLNTGNDCDSQIPSGRVFQIPGTEMRKACEPNSYRYIKWKSAQRDVNTACQPQFPHKRTESAMAVVRQSQNSPPPSQTSSRGAGLPKFNQLETVSHYLHLQTQFGEDRCTQFQVIMVTDTARPLVHHKHTDRTDYTKLCR